jgi:Kef-type K+ transport system membrane component KefB
VCAGIIAVATAGKLGGTLIAARATQMSWGDSFALGALMNTRGLVELIVLNVGYDLGILSPEIFTMLVLMALVTTFMTGPLLDWREGWSRKALAATGKPASVSG